MMKNKKAAVSELFGFILVALIMVILVGALLYTSGIVKEALVGENIVTSNGINISDYASDTYGRVDSAFVNNADLIVIFFLFGTAIAIMITGFLSRHQTPPLFFVIEIIVTIFLYIIAVYVSNAYETILTQLPFFDLIQDNLSNSSNLVLYLPIITVVIAVITMILTYSAIPRQEEEGVGGF